MVVVALGLIALFGATYLGARGYFGLSSLLAGSGTLVVESKPSGAELFVDGQQKGRTPVTLQLDAGEHTLTLRLGKSTTLVPVMVVSGARRIERVEIRQRRRGPARPPAPAVSSPLSAKPAEQASARLDR